MPAPTVDPTRRRIVPTAAGRSLWLSAVWTGVGAAVVCATVAIVAVAICWLPVAGASGQTSSALRAGLLTFLAGLHGGITVDGTAAQFVPLGITVLIAMTAWRAALGLADAARGLREKDPTRLLVAALLQAASFAIAVMVMVPFADLGTSRAPLLGAGGAAFVLFAVVGGGRFVGASALRKKVAARLPATLVPGIRAGLGVVAGYTAAGSVLVAASLVLHAEAVQSLSRQVGGGWGNVPVLALGVLAVPNAIVAGMGYLAGPGFAVGSGTAVGPLASTHGVVPAFPLLGALPHGHGATLPAWVLILAAPVTIGCLLARFAWREPGWFARFTTTGTALGTAGVLVAVLAWQGGGGIGGGRLRTVGASPWLVPLMIVAEVGAVVAVALAAAWAWSLVRERGSDADAPPTEPARRLVRLVKSVAATGRDESDEPGKLAG
jgi:hypothetical protein